MQLSGPPSKRASAHSGLEHSGVVPPQLEQGFRLRGGQVTRLETFVDAAFAFAVTLLVVSFGAMPDSFDDLYQALRRLPTFAAGFAIIIMFWAAHYRFSRRFGLHDTPVMLLSLLLVGVTLFYVYPLRMVMSAAMHWMTGGWVPSELVANDALEYRLIWMIYGVGFALLAGIIVLLNRHALRQSDALQLDPAERAIASVEVTVNLVMVAAAVLSVTLALVLPMQRAGWHHALPGLAYALLGVVLPVVGVRASRRIDRLIAERDGQAGSTQTGSSQTGSSQASSSQAVPTQAASPPPGPT